jgi:hypothetical protein
MIGWLIKGEKQTGFDEADSVYQLLTSQGKLDGDSETVSLLSPEKNIKNIGASVAGSPLTTNQRHRRTTTFSGLVYFTIYFIYYVFTALHSVHL